MLELDNLTVNTIKSEELDCFIRFNEPIAGYTLPERFTFPFYYEPHPLSLLAAKELQDYIEHQNEWQHNFGLDSSKEGIGKMFGVLVVQNQHDEIGYIAAFSGKLAGGNHHSRFVPPVFDTLDEAGFYRIGEEENNITNRRIEVLENTPRFV